MKKHIATMLAKKMKAAQAKAEDGMVTAEYALGTVATTSLAGLLIWLSKQEWLREGIAAIFKMILQGGA